MSAAAGALDFDEVDELLASGPTFEHQRMLSDLDGFLTAVAIGPEPIPASEWLHQIVGSNRPVFGSEELRELLDDMLKDRFDGIVDMLERYPEAYEPDIFEDPETGETTVEAWAEGFLWGVRLRGRAWQAIIRSEVGRTYFTPIALFMRNHEGNYALTADDVPDIDRLRSEADQHLSGAVVGMYRFLRQNRHYFEGATKLGRNDPCFCGSGKKFKKCCGAGRR